MKQKHIHFIGVCGVGMGAVAVMMKKMGWKVTGSDKGFFPPISDFLKKNKIDFYPGWHPEKFTDLQKMEKKPDLVVVGNFISLNNPEYLWFKKQKYDIKSYPEIVAQYVVKKNSIVATGTFGKTTISAFVAHAFKTANLKPSWFIGGLANNFVCGAKNNSSKWSVAEGDEYTTARWDPRSKFLLYQPTHLILTSIIWDHFDVFPTEKKYDESFKKLIDLIPENGIIVAAKRKNTQKIDKMILKSRALVLRYGKKGTISSSQDYGYQIKSLDKKGARFSIYHENKKLGDFQTCLLGEHLVENFCAGIALCHYCGIKTTALKKAVKTFKGVKRRLEIRNKSKKIKVVDDLAHSPSKAMASLSALRAHFPKARIFAIYEPNVGNRTLSSEPFYKNAFQKADYVIIPRLSLTKTEPGQEKRMSGEELTKMIKEKNKGVDVFYFPDDDELIKFLIMAAKMDDIIVFLGSHGFRGMIEEIIKKIDKK